MFLFKVCETFLCMHVMLFMMVWLCAFPMPVYYFPVLYLQIKFMMVDFFMSLNNHIVLINMNKSPGYILLTKKGWVGKEVHYYFLELCVAQGE